MPIQDFVQKLKSNQGTSAQPADGPETGALSAFDREALADAMRDYTQEMAPDPRPARRAEPRARKMPAAPKASAAVRREVADGITMMLSMPAGLWSFHDPVCGGAVLDHAENIAAKLTPIVCRNPVLLAWFTDTGHFMDWFALFTALAPVARTVWDHHVTGPRELRGGDQDAGRTADDGPAAVGAAYESLFAAPSFSAA